ncbi:MAG: helix-turn-helix transcriptional regulator [Clostridiales bacterium]|mgnify:CR=1 FL=1|jgi:transcriptional regulator with XRE-family HTH domain|nr:helix-turn-helix transcriptional regulator [Clostridiales bacterium]
MASVFAQRLSSIRKECGLNQRSAASEMNISQALLSHYENGIREPGLDFVTRACEFYGVSADYLLGRTSVKDGAAVVRSRAAGSVAENSEALEHKRRLTSSISLIFDCFGSSLEPRALQALANYMYCRICRILTYLPVELPSGAQFSDKKLCAALHLLEEESALIMLASHPGKDLDVKWLEKQYPERFRDLYQAVESVARSAINRISAAE